ncbi:MAG: hypothetical protein QG620_253 [Patescibacteria group bacterium]|nr:hypothetical protein [Patescibacteria group bacterium]
MDNILMAIKSKIKSEVASVRHEIRNKVAGYIVAAFGLVAGLAWNDAIKSFIDYFFPAEQNGLKAKFSYAILITFIVVMVSVYVVKFLKEEEKEEEKEKKK